VGGVIAGATLTEAVTELEKITLSIFSKRVSSTDPAG